MFKVKWDQDINGVILDDSIKENEEVAFPRPVFLQELELLEIGKRIRLPKTTMPICWCIDYRYYYKGILFFERRGANIYTKPTIVYNEEFPYTVLEPINVDLMVNRNRAKIHVLEDEAMDFIQFCYDKYGNSVDDTVVAFSGGKDSQVILDLVSRVLPPESYKAIFQDTDMELPCTYDIVRYTEEDYKYRFPNFQMFHAQSDRKAIDLWKQYGPPSRINRWCCAVMKTAVFRRKMKELHKTNRQPKVLVFEGVRADESAKRESYERIGAHVKHVNLINCRAIFKWNNTEIFLYIFAREIALNPGYRLGLTRVGCGVCPFASDWSEYVIRRIYPDISKQYVSVIEDMGRNLGISDRTKLNEYVSSGNWQKNAGGRGIKPDDSRIDIITKEPNFECVVTKPKTDWKIWLNALGDYIISFDGDRICGELKYDGNLIKFYVVEEPERYRFVAENVTNKMTLIGLLTRVLTKSASCELCGVCEAECPTGALRVRDKIEYDKTMCIHCLKCLELSSRGCIIAHRKQVFEGGAIATSGNTKTSGVDKYSTFGLRDEWLANYMDLGNEWFGPYPGLGVRMIPAAINWLREAELIDPREKIVATQYGILCAKYREKPLLVWQIVWINLAFNSAIVNEYVRKVRFNVSYEKSDLIEIAKEDFSNLNDTTIKNPIDAMLNMFRSSPLGQIVGENKPSQNVSVAEIELGGKNIKRVRRVATANVFLASLTYLLYKMAEKEKRFEFTVSELLNSEGLTPATVFGMNSDNVIKALRTLTQMGVLSADLLGGLENVHLEKDLAPNEALKMLIQRM